MIPPIDYGALSLAATAYACDGSRGRPHLGDPVSNAITEGRQEQTERMRRHQRALGVPESKLAFYSSCADLCHWHYWAIGVQQPWVNRDESKAVDGLGWVVEKNILLLVGASGCAEPTEPGDTYEPGDVLHIGTPGTNRDHVMVVRSHDAFAGSVVVAEYGQPGGKIQSHPLLLKRTGTGAYMQMGSRRLLHVLRLTRVLEQADRDGKLVPPRAELMAMLEGWSEPPAVA